MVDLRTICKTATNSNKLRQALLSYSYLAAITIESCLIDYFPVKNRVSRAAACTADRADRVLLSWPISLLAPTAKV